MNQKKKVLLVLFYQGTSTTEKISDMLGHCNSSIMSELKKMGLICIQPRKKQDAQGIRSLNCTGYNVAEMIKKNISFWTKCKLVLGVKVR